MIAGQQLSERLDPHVGSPLASVMAENQELLIATERYVDGDMQKASELVNAERWEEPQPRPDEKRQAALTFLIKAQKDWFDEICTSPDGVECSTLANVCESEIILIRHNASDGSTTLLQAMPDSDRQVRVSKTKYSPHDNMRSYDLAIEAADKRVMSAAATRLRLINLKWSRLLREHGPAPTPDQSHIPSPRIPSTRS